MKTLKSFLESASKNTLNYYRFPTKIYFLLYVFLHIFINAGFRLIYDQTRDINLKRICHYPFPSKFASIAINNNMKCGFIGYFLLGFRANATFIIPLSLSFLQAPIIFIYAVYAPTILFCVSLSSISFIIGVAFIYRLGSLDFDLNDFGFILLMLYFNIKVIYSIMKTINRHKTVEEPK